jgi:hypothetical protein
LNLAAAPAPSAKPVFPAVPARVDTVPEEVTFLMVALKKSAT